MIGKLLYATCAAGLIAATAVMAEAPSETTGKAAKADPNQRICRTFHDTGSRLGGYRACHTAAEWAEMRRQTVQNIDHIQNSRAGDAQ